MEIYFYHDMLLFLKRYQPTPQSIYQKYIPTKKKRKQQQNVFMKGGRSGQLQSTGNFTPSFPLVAADLGEEKTLRKKN